MQNFKEYLQEMAIVEMARADLKGAEEALKQKDWSKVAKKYIENASVRLKEKNKELGDEDVKKKVRAGLAVTFRNYDEKVLSAEDVKELKDEIKKQLGVVTKAEKKTKKVGEKTEKDSEAFLKAVGKQKADMAEASKKKRAELIKKSKVMEDILGKSELLSVLEGKKPKMDAVEDDEKEFTCKKCGESFKSKKQLKKHNKICG